MQGFNMGRYVPPEFEGQVSGNKLAGKHALGARGRKAGQGVLTVRFEMPYAIWCTNCPSETIIGQGVRFNAEKKKVGNYYSSPIYSFRMKHTACGGWIEIRTDPKNTAYVVTEGARKRETGEDEARDGDIVLKTEEEKERLRNDAFAALEVTIEGREQGKIDADRINELLDSTDRHWEDPYAANKILRDAFRAGRKQREKESTVTEGIREKYGLSMDLLPADEVDARRAAYVDFGVIDKNHDTAVQRAESRGLFTGDSKHKRSNDNRTRRTATDTKQQLQEAIGNHIRHAIDPFLKMDKASFTSIAGIKRKRAIDPSSAESPAIQSKVATKKGILVDYDSD